MKNFCLLYGDDKAILNKEIEGIKKKIDVDENNIIYYNINEVKDIVNEAETISMFSSAKLLIIDATSYFCDKKDISDIELLESYFEHFNSNSYLLFVCNGDTIDSRKKLVKLITAKGTIKKVEVSDNYLTTFIEDYLKAENYEISLSNINYLISRCGNNVDNLTNELDKLMLYKVEDKKILKEDIDLLTNENIDDNVFDLISSILKKDYQRTIKLYNNFIMNGMDASQIIALLSSQIRLLFQVKRLYNQGKSNDEIAKIMEFKSVYRVKYLLSDSYYYTERDLLKYLSLLADLDKNIKLGLVDAKTGLELLIMKKDM